MLERVFIHVANGQIGVCVHDDAVFIDLLNHIQIDDIGAVYAHKIVGQSFFHLLHGQQGDNGLGIALQIDFQVFAHGLDVADVADVDLDNAVFGLEENGVVFEG